MLPPSMRPVTKAQPVRREPPPARFAIPVDSEVAGLGHRAVTEGESAVTGFWRARPAESTGRVDSGYGRFILISVG